MYEDGIRVTYQLYGREESPYMGERGVGEVAHVDLPGWCAGEPRLAVALYLFGSRDHEDDVRLIDWQPR